MTHGPKHEASDRFAIALSKLRRLDRVILLLSARRRLGNAAIAKRLHLSTDEVERRLARGLRKFDRWLGD
ncbi:sigma factor-like helix-turn-helix DNA-binding protein [Sphingomonas sp. ASV193]